MAQKTLELKLISARDLHSVNLISKMEVYAVVSVGGDPRTRQRVATDRFGGTSPAWNATLKFPLDPHHASGAATIHVLLRTERALGDRDVGEVHIPLSEVLTVPGGSSAPQFVSYQVRSIGSGKAKGVLNLSYKIIDPVAYAVPPSAAKADPYSPIKAYPPPQQDLPANYAAAAPAAYPPPAKSAAESQSNYYAPSASAPPGKLDAPVTAYPASSGKSDEPVTAYPAAGQPAYPAAPAGYPPQGYPSYASPPPQYAYGYGAQPPPPVAAGYGYRPAGYGYQAVPQQRPNKNKFGMGLGAGLLGGAVGGLLLGDLVSDAASQHSGYDAGYDAGYDNGFDNGSYDAGFDDGGGFGFDF